MGNLELRKFTRTTWNDFYKNYNFDPMMEDEPYLYDEEKVNLNFDVRMADTTREYFAICNDEKIIGQIYLKHINKEKKSAEFGVALINNSVKNKGLGTKAIKTLLDYAFNTLGLSSIYADTIIRNKRSQHILEKVGFSKIMEDSSFIFYKIDRTDNI